MLNKGLNTIPDGFIIGNLLLPFLVSSSCIYVMYSLLQLRLGKKKQSVDTYREKKWETWGP